MIFSLIINLALGALAGWIAGNIMNVQGSLIRNILLGVCGGIVGSIVLGIVGISGRGRIGSTIVSVIGACILIWLEKKLKER